jgi:hypothetical protein
MTFTQTNSYGTSPVLSCEHHHNTIMDPTTLPGTTNPLPQSTPIKADSSTAFPFTTTRKYHIESCTAMAEKMKEYIVGPPLQDDFFPTNSINHYGHGVAGEFHAGCCDDMVTAGAEMQAHEPFVSLSKEFCFISFSQLFLL